MNLAIILVISLICLTNNVKADVIPIDQIGGIMNNNSYDFPQFYWFSTDDLDLDFGLYLYNYQGLTTPYSYLVYSVCSNTKLSVKIVNGGYTNYFSDDSAKIVSSGSNCTAGGYGGTLYYIQLQVGEYGDLDGTGSELVASSRIYYTSGYSWGGYLEFRNFYLSSEDLVTAMINDQKQLDAMNKIETQITSTNNKIDQTNQKLDDIYNEDIGDEYKELPDDSEYQEYMNTEDSLKDKVNQADLSNLSIGIDSKSSSWVWDTLTSLINSHSVIFGMFIAILSIGIIKLALGR